MCVCGTVCVCMFLLVGAILHSTGGAPLSTLGQFLVLGPALNCHSIAFLFLFWVGTFEPQVQKTVLRPGPHPMKLPRGPKTWVKAVP